MEYFVSFGSVIDSFISSLISLVVLWFFSAFCFMELEKIAESQEKAKEAAGKKLGDQTRKLNLPSLATSIGNAEKFLQLFDTWLLEVDRNKEGHPSVAQHIQTLQSAEKELRKIQIVMESYKTCAVYASDPNDNSDCKKIQSLLAKFEYTKAYVNLRRYLLEASEGQFEVWLRQGRQLKVWLAESLSLLEVMHSMSCESDTEIRKQLQLQKVLTVETEKMWKYFEIYKNTTWQLTENLREIGHWSGKFEKRLGEKYQNGTKRWHELLTVSVTEEMTQVNERFSTVIRLTECYLAHLEYLQQIPRTPASTPQTLKKSIADLSSSIMSTKGSRHNLFLKEP
ncbi:uncharacterized protein RCH25_007868 [Pelodytes ibericus]